MDNKIAMLGRSRTSGQKANEGAGYQASDEPYVKERKVAFDRQRQLNDASRSSDCGIANEIVRNSTNMEYFPARAKSRTPASLSADQCPSSLLTLRIYTANIRIIFYPLHLHFCSSRRCNSERDFEKPNFFFSSDICHTSLL